MKASPSNHFPSFSFVSSQSGSELREAMIQTHPWISSIHLHFYFKNFCFPFWLVEVPYSRLKRPIKHVCPSPLSNKPQVSMQPESMDFFFKPHIIFDAIITCVTLKYCNITNTMPHHFGLYLFYSLFTYGISTIFFEGILIFLFF